MQIKFRKKSREFQGDRLSRQFMRLRVFNLFFFGLFIVIVGWTAFYVQQTIKSATVQAQQIIIIKSELSIEAINFDDFEKVEKAWIDKHNPEVQTLDKNPFLSIIPPTELELEESGAINL